jgi:hypothetical protein
MRRAALILSIALSACGSASVAQPQPRNTGTTAGYQLVLPSSGLSTAVGQDTLIFSANNAPVGTTVLLGTVPAPTPKWPLPEQIAGYTVTLNHAVTFAAFPSLCVTGNFAPSRSYWVQINAPDGTMVEKASATPSSTQVCNTAGIGGTMDANVVYTIAMWMTSS